MRLLIALLGAAAAWGGVWLGPSAGWTRAAGSTGYAETDGDDVGRAAPFWGAAGGYSAGPLYADGTVSFLPGGSDAGPLTSGWGGERKATSYDELNGELAGGWRLGEGGLKPTVGLSAYWGHATYEGKDLSPWTPRPGSATAVYGRVVNDFFAAPAAGVELWTGPVKWSGAAAAGYRAHRESGGEWRVVYYESGHREKGYFPYSLAVDFVALQGEAALTWRAWGLFGVRAWVAARADAFRLGGDAGPGAGDNARQDFTLGAAPVINFL